jgi:hypothetical protein
MVDIQQIEHLLNKHFKTEGKITIDHHTGVVNVQGNVYLYPKHDVLHLPVTFGQVSGAFQCFNNMLVDLNGAPRHVGGLFDCGYNRLTYLKGAPDHVGGWFSCRDNPLESLEGAPDHVDKMFYMSYQEHTPLLRLIKYDQFTIRDAPYPVQEIMNKYAGKGKSHILLCSNELKKAGFAGNATW